MNIDAFSINLVSGGWEIAIVGGFDLAVSWATCFFVYMGADVGWKLRKYILKKKKEKEE